jgi:hypothetical protein
MPLMQSPYVSQALSRLRRGVTVCCWVAGLSLVAQLLVWGTATFMDVRHKALEDAAPPGQIVSAEASQSHAKSNGPLVVNATEKAAEAAESAPIDLNRIRTSNDRVMEVISATAMSAGTLAIILVLPLLALGVLLGAGSATPGIDHSVSAFMWSLLVAVLVLPLGHVVGLPWNEGALASYSYMTGEVDRVMTEGSESWGNASFYCRFALLPLACVVGVTMIGLRFGAGVHAGIMPKEDMRLDPVLEKEAGNIKASSLHAGRAGAALRAASAAIAEKKPIPAINQVTAGDAPKRLI